MLQWMGIVTGTGCWWRCQAWKHGSTGSCPNPHRIISFDETNQCAYQITVLDRTTPYTAYVEWQGKSRYSQGGESQSRRYRKSNHYFLRQRLTWLVMDWSNSRYCRLYWYWVGKRSQPGTLGMKLGCDIESTSADDNARLNAPILVLGIQQGISHCRHKPSSNSIRWAVFQRPVHSSQWMGPKIRMNLDSRGVMLLSELQTDQDLYCDLWSCVMSRPRCVHYHSVWQHIQELYTYI